MFEIKKLSVKAGEKEIINGIDLAINAGEVHVIMGPNGAGKSTLANAIMGHPKLEVHGQIIMDGEDMTNCPPNERSKRGIFLAFQAPQEIEGVSLFNFLRKSTGTTEEKGKPSKELLEKMMKLKEEVEGAAAQVGMPKEFIKRDINVGFSGGEKKRAEMLQMIVMKPRLVVLDEIDSGLDIDALKTVANTINQMNDGKRGFLIITHYQRILDYIKPDFVHILSNGKIVKSGDHTLAQELEQKGYSAIVGNSTGN